MKEAKDVEKEFKKELSELLSKYDADIDIVFEGRDYVQYPTIEISIPTIYNNNGDMTRESCDFKI